MTESELTAVIKDTLTGLYREKFDGDITQFEPLYAHGSDRNIIRLHGSKLSPLIGIYNNNIPENTAFIKFSAHFRGKKLNVPEIFHVSADIKSYLMEDLGNTTLYDKVHNDSEHFCAENIALYKNAIRQLIRFQADAGKTIDFGLCYQFREFGSENIESDINYFRHRFLSEMYKSKFDEAKLIHDLKYLKSKLLEPARDNFLYRDFQSRNIMLHKNDLYFIDYQSGRKGALQYDIASLLYDARADVPQELREVLLDYYIKTLNNTFHVNPDEFKFYFWYFAVIRILQAMGAYGYLGFTKGRTKFLKSIPFGLKNINFILNNRIEEGKLEYLKTIFSVIKYEPAPN